MNKDNVQSIGNPLPLRILKTVYPVMEKFLPGIAFSIALRLFFTPLKHPTPERELSILKSAEKFDCKINGKRTQFYSWGKKGNPLAVMVHGWMGRSSQFFKLIEAFLEKDYHVISFDGPAHGASSGRVTDVFEFAEAIDYISTKHGPIHCAIGHSYGGITILNAIERGTKIDNVILIATPTVGKDIILQFEEKLKATPETGRRFLKAMHKRHGVTFESTTVSEIIKKVALKNLLLVHDESDKDVPFKHAQEIKKIMPEAKTIFTNGLGHTRILRNDAVIKQIIDTSSSCIAEPLVIH